MRTKILPLILGFVMALPSGSVQTNPPELLSVANLAIPESLGKVQDRFTGTSTRWVVQIQDVHGHVTAQENIAAILDHLQAVYGIKTVAVEGAWRSTNLPESWALPNSRAKQQLARKLMEDGYFSGPVYAALFAPSPLLLAGIEDAPLYRENRRIYLDYLNQESEISTKAGAFESSLESEKAATFNPELLAFDKSLNKFRSGSGAEAFLPSLMMLAQSQSVEFSGLDQIALFAKILELSQRMNRDALQTEAAQMADHYKFERLSFEELLRSGKVPQEDLQSYPEVSKYMETMILQDRIDHQAFSEEIETLIQKVQAVLAGTDAEKAAVQKSERWMLVKKMVTLKSSPKDLARVEADREGVEFLASEAGLAEALTGAGTFYELAKKRDEIFFQKIISEADLSSDLALVTGGFHTEGLSEQLRVAGISYIVITPDLAGQDPDEMLYHKLLAFASVESKTENQTLSSEQVVITVKGADKVIKDAVNASISGARVDATKGEEVFLSGLADVIQEKTEGMSSANVSSTATMTDSQDVSNLSFAEKKAAIQASVQQHLLDHARTTSQPAVLVVGTAELEQILSTSDGPQYWQAGVKLQRTIIYVLNAAETGLPIAVTDAMMGVRQGRAEIRIKNIGAFADLKTTAPDFRAIMKNPDRVAVISSDPETIRRSEARILSFPPDGIWLIGYLAALDNPMARAMAATEAGRAELREILLSLENFQQVLKSA